MLATMLLAAGSTSPALAARCEPLRVMSYNIRLDLKSDGENRWEGRRDQFIGQIALMRPEILGLQEVVPRQKRDLEKALPSYEFLGVARDDGKEAGEFSNLAVLRSAFRVRSSGTFWLSETPDKPSKGWDAAFPRIATWARLTGGDGQRFLVLNTHFDHVGVIARLQAARQIEAFLAASRRPGEAIIMTGDLNSLPDSPALAALTGGTVSLRDSRLDSATPALGPAGTFNAFEALPRESRRIDYILHDPGLRTLRNATLAWHGESNRVASDHFPVVADLIQASCPEAN